MAINSALNSPLFRAAITTKASDISHEKTSFDGAIKSVDHKKTALAFLIPAWIINVIYVTAGSYIISNCLTDIGKILLGEPRTEGSREHEGLIRQIITSVMGNPQFSTLPDEMKTNVLMAIGKPRKLAGRRDKSKHSLDGGKRPDNGKPPNDDEPKKDWVQAELDYKQLRTLPRGRGMTKYGSTALYQKAIGQGGTVNIFLSLFSKVENLMHKLNQNELNIFNRIRTQMNPYFENPSQSTMSRLITHNDLKKIINELRQILRIYTPK